MSRRQPPRLASRRNLTCSLSTENALFNFNNPLPQNLCLPSTILSYVIDKLKPKSIFKLTKTCKYLKYLCERRRGRPVDALYICPRLHYDFTYCMALQIDSKSPMFETFIDGLSIEKRLSCEMGTSEDTVSRILKSAKKCSVKELYIENQVLTCAEFEKLCKNVRSCLVSCLKLSDGSENGMLIDILQRAPNAVQFEIQSWNQGIYYTPTTASCLANLKHNAKINIFRIDSIPEGFDYEGFGQFITDNFAPKCESFLHFQHHVSPPYVKQFREALKPYIQDRKFRSKPPSVSIFRFPPTPFALSDWELSMQQYMDYKFTKIFRGKKSTKTKKKNSGFFKYH